MGGHHQKNVCPTQPQLKNEFLENCLCLCGHPGPADCHHQCCATSYSSTLNSSPGSKQMHLWSVLLVRQCFQRPRMWSFAQSLRPAHWLGVDGIELTWHIDNDLIRRTVFCSAILSISASKADANSIRA